MACRQSSLRVLEPLSRSQAASTLRSFSSTSASVAPQKPFGRVNPFAKNRGPATDEEGATQGPGNALSEVTLGPLDLSHLPLFQPESLTEKAVGQVKAFPPSTLASFKAFTIPAPIQKEFAFTSAPATVVRTTTLATAALLDSSKSLPSRDSRHLLAGPSGSGKSVLLLQATSYAQSTGWVVLYLPSATPSIDSSTPHVYSSAQALFHQPLLAAQLLTRFNAANKASFKALRTRQAYTFGDVTVKAGAGLDELASKGIADSKVATAALEALLDELSHQTKQPVLLAIDDAQSLFATSSYIDPTYTAIESFSLSVPRLLLDFIAGARSFASGSILLAPSSLSKFPSVVVTEFLASKPAEALSPYRKLGSSNEVYAGIIAGLNKFVVPARLERQEAVGIVKMLQDRRGVREPMSDQSFMERYVASDGNPRHFVRGLERNTQL